MIQKLLNPIGTPRRMLYPGPSGLSTATLYEIVGEVEFVTQGKHVLGPVSQ